MFEMLKPVMKNLVSKPATRLYPVEVREPFPGTRGHLQLDTELCIHCTICAKKCPANCITVEREQKIFNFDPYACVMCSVCVEACPKSALSMNSYWRKPGVTKGRLDK